MVLIFFCFILVAGPGLVKANEESPFQLYTTLVESFYEQNKLAAARWQEQVAILDHQRVLDFTDLKQQADFERHASALQQYRQASDEYLAYLSELRQRTTELFSIHELTDEQLQPVLDNLMNQYQPQRGVLLELLAVHLSYANSMQGFLTFLQTNHENWAIKAGQVSIDDEQLSRQYNQFIDRMISHEDQIAALMPKLLPDSR